ncbi:carbohydrate ABC transporter permease [Paenibacillus qinlingensis]|uniref:Aldouronate transport system permease protein n=1 Tax=Paenibacillus qinlingensis TaxID=1837343 RepID=A0ABU1NWK0_9BACL|nr:carbohydrate ABC transporter permease [Paenibacillus qinlingensis]MDR6551859.1 putative aldouronate transport system permease protein [Paenibacillus qinlingensis]
MKHKSISDIVFDVCNYIFLTLLSLSTLYPFLYILFSSLSNPVELMKRTGIILWPAGFSLEAYKLVFQNPMIPTGYANTLFYVAIGTLLNIVFTSLTAFALSRRNVMLRDPIMMAIVFTMFFGGGLVPSYLLVKGVGLYDTRWALIIPGLISTMNLIILRTSFQSIPESLEESAKIDGANDFTVFTKVVMPLSIPVLSVMVLFYGVAHWNSYFSALIYLRSRDLYPLQLVLREILITNNSESMLTDVGAFDKAYVGETIKYATIIIATLPILLLYPFLQKYFVKGVMIGAIKG